MLVHNTLHISRINAKLNKAMYYDAKIDQLVKTYSLDRLKVRVDGLGYHRLVTLNTLRTLIPSFLVYKALLRFAASEAVNCTIRYRRGLKIEIFEN